MGTGFYASGTTRCCRTWKACVRRSLKSCGVTPSQPSPIEGEGFDNILDQRLRWPDGYAKLSSDHEHSYCRRGEEPALETDRPRFEGRGDCHHPPRPAVVELK